MEGIKAPSLGYLTLFTTEGQTRSLFSIATGVHNTPASAIHSILSTQVLSLLWVGQDLPMIMLYLKRSMGFIRANSPKEKAEKLYYDRLCRMTQINRPLINTGRFSFIKNQCSMRSQTEHHGFSRG